MAKQTVNIGSTANDGTGDQLRNAFDKLNQNNDEIYGDNFVTEDMLNDNIVGADELKVTGDGSVGQILTSNADGTFSWTTGVAGDITGVEAGAGLTGGGTGGDVTLNVVAGTGITVTADEVALDTTVQDEITLNTAKVGITTAQAADIVTNNAKVSDQTVTLTEGANVTITGTYPSFTIASDDVVGAVNSVNGDTGVVVLDTADIAENTNLYYTEARVSANTDVAANTAKIGITSAQASEIAANTLKVGITTAQAGEITANNAKVSNVTTDLSITGTTDARTIVSSDGTDAIIPVASTTESGLMSKTIFDEHVLNTAKLTNATHTGEVTGDGALTIADGAVVADRLATNAVTTDKILDNAVDYDKLADEFTTSAAISALDVDFSSAAVFTKALSGTTTLTFSNVETGMVKTLVISGNQSLALPSGVTILNGTYSGTATTNVIQIVSTNGSTQMFATVSNV